MIGKITPVHQLLATGGGARSSVWLTRVRDQKGDKTGRLKVLNFHPSACPMFTLEELFCCVDDFCQSFEPQWERQLLGNRLQKRKRDRSLCLSEIMTIVIGFHQSCYRNFKAYYQDKVQVKLQPYFPGLVSNRERNARVDA